MNDPPVEGEMDDDALRYNLAVKNASFFKEIFCKTVIRNFTQIFTFLINYSSTFSSNVKESVYSVAL